MHHRRIVTGQRNGRAVFVEDARVAPIHVALVPGGEFHRIWGSDSTPELPASGYLPRAASWFPPVGGYRFAFVTFPPEAPPPEDLNVDAAVAELEQRLPGMARVLEPDAPGMHTTDTVDFGVVLSGSIFLELDDGAEVELRAGDTVVQNGTRHRWRNRGAGPCVMAVTMIGGERR
jgi:mannose-6-phosphate isomerase-like protein (cupin superfamily)